jgi:hypothetical protein
VDHGAPGDRSVSKAGDAGFPPNSFTIDVERQGFGTGTVEILLDDFPVGSSGTPEDFLLLAPWFYRHQPSSSRSAPRPLRVGDVIHLRSTLRFQIAQRGFPSLSPEPRPFWGEF